MSLLKVGNLVLIGGTWDRTSGWEAGGRESTGDCGGIMRSLDWVQSRGALSCQGEVVSSGRGKATYGKGRRKPNTSSVHLLGLLR